MSKFKATTADEYINAALKVAQEKLYELRSILKEVVPNATETLKWGSPVFEKIRTINIKLVTRQLKFSNIKNS
jgi:uncharacterized protein YdhG (YjbR/CyaY superfamily)